VNYAPWSVVQRVALSAVRHWLKDRGSPPARAMSCRQCGAALPASLDDNLECPACRFHDRREQGDSAPAEPGTPAGG
jgi:hypothetical protein